MTAAVAAMAGLDRPLRRALRVLPTVGAALLAAVAIVIVAVLLIGLLAPDADVLWVVVALVALPVGLLLVRFALVLPIALFEDRRGRAAFRAASESVRRHVVSLGILLLLGVAGPAQLLGWAFAHPEEHVSDHLQGLLAWLIRDVGLVFVAALQASTLLVAYRNLPGRLLVPPPASVPAVEKLRSHEHSGSRTRRIGRLALPLGLASVLLPTVLAGGVVASESAPEVAIETPERPHQMTAVGWPAGRGPILVGVQSIEDCLDDQCRTIRRTPLSVVMYEPMGGAVFGADGSVYALGSAQQLEQCDAQRVCQRSKRGLKALRGSEAWAIALSPAGDILIASATEVRSGGPVDGAPHEETRHVELKLIRCPDVFCADPRVTSFGLMDDSRRHWVDNRLTTKIAVRVDGSGRPVVAYRSPYTGVVSLGWCLTPECDRADVAPFGDVRRPGMPTTEELALLDFDDGLDCWTEHGCRREDPVAVVHRPQGDVYEVLIEQAYTDGGFQVHVGPSAPRPSRAVLRICADPLCRGPKRIPLVDVPGIHTDQPGRPQYEQWLMAVAPDGRMVATHPFGDHTVIVRP